MLYPTHHENLETSFSNFKTAYLGTEDISGIYEGKPNTILMNLRNEFNAISITNPYYAGSEELYSGDNILI